MSLGFHALINPRTSTRRVGALTLFSLAGLVIGSGVQTASAATDGPAASASGTGAIGSTGNQNLEQGKKMFVRLSQEQQMEMDIARPQARESRALRVVNPSLPMMNFEVTVLSRIVVGVESEEVLKAAIAQIEQNRGTGRPGSHSVRSFLGESTVFVVEGNSVEDAINLANDLSGMAGIEWTEVDYNESVVPHSVDRGGGSMIPTDPSYANEWHISNTTGGVSSNDHKVRFVHDMGYTGSGVVVGVLEAFANSFYHVDQFGVEFVHPDLEPNLRRTLSVETDPFNIFYSHGVSVAGIIGATGNNGLAGAGIAYNAGLASLRGGGNGVTNGESFGHELQEIDIVNNSWGPTQGGFPPDNTGKYLAALPDDFEITIPQNPHSGMTRSQFIGLDQGIRLGRGGKGRLFTFSAGNNSTFQGWARFATGNAISLPGIGTSGGVIPSYGYLDILGLDPNRTDANFDGIPDAFDISGAVTTGWRYSGHFGDRADYSTRASNERTFSIASVGQSNTVSGYSNTGTSVFASAYSMDSIKAQEFTPGPPAGWFDSGPANPIGIITLEQQDTADDDSGACAGTFGIGFVDDDLETCQFNGTSAAAPVAAGIMALMLEANPSLNIRDVQHILVQTSRIDPYDEDGDSIVDPEDFRGLDYNPTESYWPSVFLGLGETDPDGNPPQPTFWSTNTAGVRHSDAYGFGLIDAKAAVEAAAGWTSLGPGYILDSETIEVEDGEIEDAVFEQAAVISENLETNRLVPGTRNTIDLSCVRSNLIVEGVELTITIDGDGAGDLLIALRSPRGTISPLAIPRGDSNNLDGTAYNGYTFTTYKHWGELSGGTWQLILQDFRPNEESPEGDLPADPPDPDDLGLEQVTDLGVFGLPGNPDHTELTLVSYRLKIYAGDSGVDVFEGCPPQLTQCPGDLDGNGLIDIFDFQIFINWYISGNILADINGDGSVNYNDINSFRAIWIPGFCNESGLTGGRPSGINNNSDPIIRPI
ncbi:MAG: S8 family serine peptidase [Phycisphaerales bacterium]|nr:S8 family serine peptidase [Phycisphaerales bacterium]